MSLICSVNVSGTNVEPCGTYPDCDPTCCNNNYSGCTGTTTGCEGKPYALCGGPCCEWFQPPGKPAYCRGVSCVGMSEATCGGCAGCTKTGSCSNKTCASGAGTDLLACKGCDTCSGTATLSGTVDLRNYWSINLKAKSPTICFKTTAVNDSLIQDDTHKLNFPV